MPRLTLTDAAVADFAAILDYITRQSGSRTIGRSFTDSLLMQCSRLAGLPGSLGRPRPELRPDIRSFPFRGYVIFFRYHADIFEVVSILEGHRDVIAHFRDEQP